MEFSMNRRSLFVFLLAAVMVAAPIAGRADTLDDIMKAGVIKVAVPQDFPPFGSVGSDLKPVGYDIDTANLIGKKMARTGLRICRPRKWTWSFRVWARTRSARK
jgi:polar amino acid transport system substrate-binding protein